MKRYVLGFAFGHNRGEETVLLIRKLRPAWQHGLLNGIGGHIEEGETPVQAMVREFQEECTLPSSPADWRHYATLTGPDWEMFVYTTRAVCIADARSTGAEYVVEASVKNGLGTSCVGNLSWLVAMAKDMDLGSRPLMIEYGPQPGHASAAQ